MTDLAAQFLREWIQVSGHGETLACPELARQGQVARLTGRGSSTRLGSGSSFHFILRDHATSLGRTASDIDEVAARRTNGAFAFDSRGGEAGARYGSLAGAGVPA